MRWDSLLMTCMVLSISRFASAQTAARRLAGRVRAGRTAGAGVRAGGLGGHWKGLRGARTAGAGVRLRGRLGGRGPPGGWAAPQVRGYVWCWVRGWVAWERFTNVFGGMCQAAPQVRGVGAGPRGQRWAGYVGSKFYLKKKKKLNNRLKEKTRPTLR